MRGQWASFIGSPIRAGLTRGGLLSRPARRHTDIPRGAPGHVPRPIEVDVQPISAALACECSPRTSGLAAAAPAAVAGRKRPRQDPDVHPLPDPLVAHHVLLTPERPGVKSAIPCSARSDSATNPLQVFQRQERLGELTGPSDQRRGAFMQVRTNDPGFAIFHGDDLVPTACLLQPGTNHPGPTPRFIEPADRHPQYPKDLPSEIAGHRDHEMPGDVQIDPDSCPAGTRGRRWGGDPESQMQEQLIALEDKLAVSRLRRPYLPERARLAGDADPDRIATHAHLGPVLISPREQPQRPRDVEPEWWDPAPVRKAPTPTRTTSRLVRRVCLVGFVPARFGHLRGHPEDITQVAIDEGMKRECAVRAVLLGLLNAEVEPVPPWDGHKPQQPPNLGRVRPLRLERVRDVAHLDSPSTTDAPSPCQDRSAIFLDQYEVVGGLEHGIRRGFYLQPALSILQPGRFPKPACLFPRLKSGVSGAGASL